MTLFAISADSPADSRAFAAREQLDFPLLSDPDGAVGRRYTGWNADDTDVPGIIIVGRDGRIVYRQVATAKDDRLSTPALIAALDRTLGTHGRAAVRVTPLQRAQLRAELGGELDLDHHVHGVAELGLLVPFGDHLVVGPWIAVDTRADHADAAVAALLRAPLFGDVGAFELGAIAGYATGTDGATISARADLWFAVSPTLAVDIGGSFELRSDVRDGAITVGVSRLLGPTRRTRR